MLVVDKYLNQIAWLHCIRYSPNTVWGISSVFLFIDTFVYSLALASFPQILQGDLHVSESSNGVVTTMFGIGGVLGALMSGLPSDRWCKRRPFQYAAAFLYVVSGVVLFFSKQYYQLLIFRLLSGIASGITCTMLYTTVGDVYHSDLLGFKVAIIYLCNSIAYTVSPLCGQKIFNASGIQGIASMVVSMGILEILLLVFLAEDSLKLRSHRRSHYSINHTATNSVQKQQVVHYFDKQPSTDVSPITDTDSGTIATIEWHEESQGSTPIWKLLLRLPVLISTLSIVFSLGVQRILEVTIPMYLRDHFHKPNDSGIAFVINGAAMIFFVPLVGWICDWLIGKMGERMRYFIMSFGAISTVLTVLMVALARTYVVIMVGYVFFALTYLSMVIPAQSAYGDFVNNAGAEAMAQSYAISTVSWAIGAIILPPIGSALYASAGFSTPIIAIAVVSCAICLAVCLAYAMLSKELKQNK